MRSDFNPLGEQAVYPGHPVTLAYMIVKFYPSLGAAMERAAPPSPPAALCENAIPGAGGCVYEALDLLKRTKDVSFEQAVKFANESWNTSTDSAYKDRRATGQAQADRVLPLLAEALQAWRLW